MKKYVQLYEEFDPSKAKAALVDKATKLKGRIVSRKEAIKKATDRKDATGVDIAKTKLDIDNLDMEKLKLKNELIDLKVKKNKEKELKAAQAQK